MPCICWRCLGPTLACEDAAAWVWMPVSGWGWASVVAAEREEAVRPMSFHIQAPAGQTINPHHEAAERRNIEWVLRFSPGLAQDAGRLGRLRRARFSRLAAYTYPRVAVDELALICHWITWLFFHDDCWCDDSDVEEAALAVLHTRALATLRGDFTPEPGDSALLHMLVDLRERMLARADDAWLGWFIADVDGYLQSTRWEAQNRRLGLSPPLAAYVKMRRFTGAMDTVFDCIELGERLRLDPAVREHTVLSRLRLMANNCVCWANDIFSIDKELLEHNAHNLVFVLRREHGLTLAHALEQAVAMHDAELRAFEWFAARMPEFSGELRQKFGAETEAAVRIYVAGLRSWMRGNIAWSWETPRYRGCLSMRGCGVDG